MKTYVARSLYVALTSASFMTIATAGHAFADRTPAPIRYAAPAQSAPMPAAALPTQTPQLTAQSRIQFQYPGGSTPVASGAPIQFSPTATPQTFVPDYAQAATPSMAQVIPATSSVATNAAAATATMLATPVMQFDVPEPVSTAAGQAPQQPIRIASLNAQVPERTGRPLSLSRVAANPEAAIEEERGQASVYSDGFNGQPTANGEIFDETAMTAAHPTLPLPSLVQVINEDNAREVVVRVNDRGPFDGHRIIELSPRAGTVLGIQGSSGANVRLRYLGPAPVKQNPQTYASTDVEAESLPPVEEVAPALPEVSAPLRIAAAPLPEPITAPVSTPDYATPSVSARPVNVAQLSVAGPVAVGNVYIQAGAFADIANAQRLTASLRGDLSVKIEEARVNGGDFFRVLVGPFPSMDDAALERDYLSRNLGVDGFLTTR